MTANLVLHRGARQVSEDELRTLGCPPSTPTWYPLPHAQVLDTVRDRLSTAGFNVQRQLLALARNDARFFGTLDLTNEICDGVRLAVGFRSSFDKSFPIGFCCGERVMVCDNLSFGSEVIISKRHTRFGKARFDEGVATAVASLAEYQQVAAGRIVRMRCCVLTDDRANSLMLQAWEERIVSHQLLAQVIHLYRRHDKTAFHERTAWSLFNAFTGALMSRLNNPAAHATLTIKLQSLIDGVANGDSPKTGDESSPAAQSGAVKLESATENTRTGTAFLDRIGSRSTSGGDLTQGAAPLRPANANLAA